jgi:hypothetical protein
VLSHLLATGDLDSARRVKSDQVEARRGEVDMLARDLIELGTIYRLRFDWLQALKSYREARYPPIANWQRPTRRLTFRRSPRRRITRRFFTRHAAHESSGRSQSGGAVHSPRMGESPPVGFTFPLSPRTAQGGSQRREIFLKNPDGQSCVCALLFTGQIPTLSLRVRSA